MRNAARGNSSGLLSVALTLAFGTYVYSGIGPNAFTRSPFVQFVLLPLMLLGAALFAIAAAYCGSKWWLLALLGPAWGTMLLLMAGA